MADILRYKGDWYTCADYATNDVAKRHGKYYKALQQNAGKDPAIQENLNVYWAELDEDELEDVAEFGGICFHNDTLRKDGTQSAQDDDYWGHLGRDETDAAANAHHPSAQNPFLTMEDLPQLAKDIGEAKPIPLPEGVSFIYGASFDDVNKILALASDDVIAWYFVKDKEWKVVEIDGAWRDIVPFGGEWVAVGVDCAAKGTPDGMTAHNIMAGNYIALATSGSKVLAVGDGVQSISADGIAWDSKAVDIGGGEGVCFDERMGKFIRVGKAGAFAVDGNGDVSEISDFPDGSWRDIVRGDGVTVACSGKLAYKRDVDDNWHTNQTYVGGWDGIAEGSGFIIGVTEGKAGFARAVSGTFGAIEIPSYIYTGVTYGASAFWAYGSKLVCYNVRDVAAALNAAEDPNADNPFETSSSVDKRIDDAFTDFTDKLPQLGDRDEFVNVILNKLAPTFVTEVQNVINTDQTTRSLISAIVDQLVPVVVKRIYDTNDNGIIDRSERADTATSADSATVADSANSVAVGNIQGLDEYLRSLGLINPDQEGTDVVTLIEAIRNFSKITVDGSEIAPNDNQDTLTITSGANISTQVSGKTVTISANLSPVDLIATNPEWETGTATDKAPSVAQVMQKVSQATTAKAGIARLAVVPGVDDQGSNYTTSAATPAYVKAVLEAM